MECIMITHRYLDYIYNMVLGLKTIRYLYSALILVGKQYGDYVIKNSTLSGGWK